MGKRLLVKHEDSKEMIFVTISILFFCNKIFES